jgi:hypothetical protein
VILLAAFTAWQGRYTGEPLLPLRLFRYSSFTASSIAIASVAFALTGMYLPLML